MTPNDKILGFIRTYVPYAVGASAAWLLLTFGIDLSGDVALGVVAFLTALITNCYYFLVRLLEVRFPWVGVFLGYAKAPDYTAVDNLWASLVRTTIPPVVSFVVVTLAGLLSTSLGTPISPDNQVGVVVIAVALTEALYYGLARAILSRWPSASWLLGAPAEPEYARHLAAPQVR